MTSGVRINFFTEPNWMLYSL